ncbi:hypothetical protein Pan44_23350 [Caulifigura coniformis]|uniref:Uncharacterized protein n=1 Tax=Caulifigura coniformis TaxID=2527983 RepID=A0A517SDU6_9PLAN|nr:hypothetical protein [Caulifigura coniformis]QDT54306.1 hypothetical protein Pan44_23350 [Caulifigura coniformis]
MSALWIYVVPIVLALLIFGARPLLNFLRRREAQTARRLFKLRRESLEAKFFELASRAGKPRGLIWKECDWQEPVTFARDLESGLLTAFVGVEIHFEAVEGGDMEDVEAVSTIRDAAAVFHYRAGQWGTGGKALFNMNPADAITRLEGQFEPVS